MSSFLIFIRGNIEVKDNEEIKVEKIESQAKKKTKQNVYICDIDIIITQK